MKPAGRALYEAQRAWHLLWMPVPPSDHPNTNLCTLQVAARVPGAATSNAVDFLIAGLEGLHFVAYGSSHGSVVVACARQVGRLGCW